MSSGNKHNRQHKCCCFFFLIFYSSILSFQKLLPQYFPRQIHGPEQQAVSLHKDLLCFLRKPVASRDQLPKSAKKTSGYRNEPYEQRWGQTALHYLRGWLVKFQLRPEVDTMALPSIGIKPQCSGEGEGTTMVCLPWEQISCA